MDISGLAQAARPKKHVFIVGCHRSGTSILAELLKMHPQISGHIVEQMPPELENEGQHIQRVFPPDDALGGPGFFAFNPLAHLTEKSELATLAARAQLDEEWGAHWTADAETVLEKSPSSLLRTRFLQKLYPDAYFLCIMRHPVATAYATFSWGSQHGGADSLSPDSVVGFVDHWLVAHAIFEEDASHLKSLRRIHLEQLAAEPQTILDAICSDLGLHSYVVPAGKVTKNVNLKYIREWRRESDETRGRILVHEKAMRKYGYTVDKLSSLHCPSAESASESVGWRVHNKPLHVDAAVNGHPGPGYGSSTMAQSAGPLSSAMLLPSARSKRAAGGSKMDEQLNAPITKLARSASGPTPGVGVQRPMILTFGTRGDVQPFIPLALEMKARGMNPLIVTLPLFKHLIEGSGIAFANIVEDDDAAAPIVDDESEDFFLHGVAHFYDKHGDAMVNRVQLLVASHRVDCIVLGSLIFFLKWLRTLNLPLVHSRLAPYAAKPGESGLEAHAQDVVHFLSISRSYGFAQCIKEEDLLGAIKDMKRELTLLAYADSCEASTPIPGLPMVRTGFWASTTPIGWGAPSQLAAFFLSGAPPVCLNFGSMAVYGASWAADLLVALRACGRRILAIGELVPASVRAWEDSFWLASAPHAYVFPKCSCVVHHGGSGTTAAAAIAGVPSVIVSFLPWSDQPRFGSWAEGAGGGVHVPYAARTQAGFAAALAHALSPASLASAVGLSETLAAQRGTAAAVDAIQTYVSSGLPADTRLAFKQLDALSMLKLSDGGKLRAGLYCLLHEQHALPMQTYAARDGWLKALGKQLIAFPLYKPDWPPLHKPIDLARHDLPHTTSLIEWWYFHAHLTCPDGTPFCVFVALFSLKVGGEMLSHIHVSLLNGAAADGTAGRADNGGDMRHCYYTAGEPHAADTVVGIRKPKQDEYFERALLEVMKRHKLPLPDVVSPQRFSVPTDVFDYVCDRLHFTKCDRTGVYHVSVAPDDAAHGQSGFGFELDFTPQKPAIRNGIDGVSPGVSNDDALYYYSITRMRVHGVLVLPAPPKLEGQAAEQAELVRLRAMALGTAIINTDSSKSNAQRTICVSGLGWYDHEFGGDISRANNRKAGMKVMDVQWAWTGLQLDDGSEVVYAKTLDNIGKGTLVDRAVLVDSVGKYELANADMEQIDTWTSLQTFICYGRSWTLKLPEQKLDLTMTAVCDCQELISVISTPAYWEGQVRVTGTRAGVPVFGFGFVEQYYGSQNQNFRTMLQAVSNVVLRNVATVFPYEPTHDHLVQLSVSSEFAEMIDGLPTSTFVEQLVNPVRAITDRQGSLIIDDIQDNSLLRRGGPCAHIEYGVPTAINAGTAAYFLGEGITRDHPNLTERQRLRVYELYFTCLRGAHVGQALDMEGFAQFMPNCIKTGDYEPMWKALLCCHRLKSGLPAAICARTGAVLGHATHQQEAALGDYFLAMGLAFQVIDDVINLQGFGKSLKTKAEDLIEGKITAPVIRAFMLLKDQPEKRAWLWAQYSVAQEERDICRMVEIIEDCGAFEVCISEAHKLVDDAWVAVDEVIPDSFSKVCLRAFGWFVCKVRDY